MRIVMIDPGNYTPYYEANLCHVLALRGHDIYLDTSEFLFEAVPPLAGYHLRRPFYRFLERFPLLNRWSRIRQALKILSYPFDMLNWCVNVGRAMPDLIHIQWSLLPLWDSILYARLQARGARLVYTAHDVLPLPSSPWNRIGYGRLYKQADQIVVHAEDSKQRLMRDFGVEAQRLTLVPMGGPGAYALPAVEQAAARRRLGLAQNAPYAMFYGLIKPHKGLDILLAALAIARRQRPDLRLLIAGETLEPWQPYADLIARLQLADAVHLHLHFVPHADLPLYFGAADLVVFPYRQIYQSGAALDACAFQRPLIATRVGGLAEIVQEGVTGYLVPPADPEALAAALVQAVSDMPKLKQMGMAAGALVAGKHSWQHIADLHEEIYRSILVSSSPAVQSK